MKAPVIAVVLVLVVGLLIVAVLFVIERIRRGRRIAAAEERRLAILTNFAHAQGLAMMTRLPIGTDLRLFQPGIGLISPDDIEQVMAGRWQERPIIAASVRHTTERGAGHVLLVVAESDYPSVDTVIYRPDLLIDFAGHAEMDLMPGLIDIPASPNAQRSLSLRCGDLGIGRLWRADTLRKRVEELDDVVLVEVKDRVVALIWATAPAGPEALELHLDSAAGLVRRLPQVDAAL